AERDAVDRFTTLYMADKVGAVFRGRISGVARFGLFARLDDTGADGIIPVRTLPDDYYIYDEKRQAFVGRRTRRVYQLAQPVVVRLEQADRLTGGMSFSIVEGDENGNEAKRPGANRDHRESRDQRKHFGRRRSKRIDN
ncbi:MAG TPA: S1 RNA-binding domain-containing protein, partial [Schlesneria sp.]